MKRVGIFQFYSECGLVEEYIEELLSSMKSVLSDLIIVYNCELKDGEIQKLMGYSNLIYKRENIGYDAGAYKDVFLGMHKEYWEQWDEMVLFNCTFYGPLFPWEEVFGRMNKEDVSFWGLSRNLGKRRMRKEGPIAPEHLQSYFLVIKKEMICSPFFCRFWERLEYPKDYYDAVENFEWKFTAYFSQNGFRYTSWLDVQGGNPYIYEGVDPCVRYVFEIVRDCKFPIIKYKSLCITNFKGMKDVLAFVDEHTTYDVTLITKRIERLSIENKWRPFSVEALEEFVNRHDNIYFFGHGMYGCGLAEYFEYRNWKFKAYVVSVPQNRDEIAFEEFEMDKKDGLIVALGKIALEEMVEVINRRFSKEQLLFPVLG